MLFFVGEVTAAPPVGIFFARSAPLQKVSAWQWKFKVVHFLGAVYLGDPKSCTFGENFVCKMVRRCPSSALGRWCWFVDWHAKGSSDANCYQRGPQQPNSYRFIKSTKGAF
jgi:hypothetical protein